MHARKQAPFQAKRHHHRHHHDHQQQQHQLGWPCFLTPALEP